MRPGAPYSGTRNYSTQMADSTPTKPQGSRTGNPTDDITKDAVDQANKAGEVLKKTTPLDSTIDGLRGGIMKSREEKYGGPDY